jgi:hypothetical protein
LQMPARQVSATEQGTASHGRLSATGWCRQLPPAQMSAVQALPSSQSLAAPTQPEAVQDSNNVQGLASSQAVPVGALPREQAPLSGLQLATSHSPAGHTTAGVNWHCGEGKAPRSQTTWPLQALPSS